MYTADLPEQAQRCISVIKCGAKNRKSRPHDRNLEWKGDYQFDKGESEEKGATSKLQSTFHVTRSPYRPVNTYWFHWPVHEALPVLRQPHLLRMSMLLLCMPSAVLLNLQSLRVSPTIQSDHFITKECFIVIILVWLCLCITQYKNLIYRLVTEGETGRNFMFFHWDHL